MNPEDISILVATNNPDYTHAIKETLEGTLPTVVDHSSIRAVAAAAVTNKKYDLAILTIDQEDAERTNNQHGLDIAYKVNKLNPNAEILIVCGMNSDDCRMGCDDLAYSCDYHFIQVDYSKNDQPSLTNKVKELIGTAVKD